MNRKYLNNVVRQIFWTNITFAFVLLAASLISVSGYTAERKESVSINNEKISLSIRNTEIVEALEMLSLKQRVNILLSEEVTGKVTVHLYDSTVKDAINAIANAGGYEAEKRGDNYFVISRDDIGKYSDSGTTDIQTYKLRYAKSSDVMDIIEEHLSRYGSITELADRNMLVIEDRPDFLRKVQRIIRKIDYRPKQILIEARILEVTLDKSETYGIDWSRVFDNNEGVVGTRGLSAAGNGLFVESVGSKLDVFLDALEEEGRTKTLSTPKLLTLENEAASVIVGDRLGYVNTVTINQVTSETTEFLESGVILEVTPSVDVQGNIKLDIHPEISTGTVTAGVPSQTTTSVQTHLLVPSGSTSFIGGLIKSQKFRDHSGVPILGRIPIAGRLFSRKVNRQVDTEIIVLITPTIVNPAEHEWQAQALSQLGESPDL